MGGAKEGEERDDIRGFGRWRGGGGGQCCVFIDSGSEAEDNSMEEETA